jgi:hypothetical protein
MLAFWFLAPLPFRGRTREPRHEASSAQGRGAAAARRAGLEERVRGWANNLTTGGTAGLLA